MTPEQFIAKWRNSTRSEKSAAQEHFLDLCELLEVPKPAEVDPHGREYTFEKPVGKLGGERGFADVWKKHCFAWEYKGPRKNLVQAYAQLKQYVDALDNPPLLIVSDMQEIRIHTNFTNAVTQQHVIALRDLTAPEVRALLRNCFLAPDRLRPTATRESVTAKAAVSFANMALRLRRDYEPRRVAHFLNKLVFCLFVEDIDLLPDRIFADILDESAKRSDDLVPMLADLFKAMANRNGRFGATAIPWFNGGLFDDSDVLPLGIATVTDLIAAARLDWKAIDPTIFGTLYESGLDEKKRAEMASLFEHETADPSRQPRLFDRAAPDKGVGIHYTDPGTIMKIIEPVVLRPLRAEWDAVKAEIRELSDRRAHARVDGQKTRLLNELRETYLKFRMRLGRFRVLDPACGSGNFLALALAALKDFDLAVIKEAAQLDLPPDDQRVGPEAVLGIEINPYAAELARLTIWITELQWQLRNGFGIKRAPILGALDGIICRDALLNRDGTEASWPDADVVIGNPPFLGNKKMQSELGESYVARLRKCFDGRLTGGVNLVCYWFEKAQALIQERKLRFAGFVTTKTIAGGTSRQVLDRIVGNAKIFDAWSDQEWVVEGAAVRVALICFCGNEEGASARLDGRDVVQIYSDLRGAGSDGDAAYDLTTARVLSENTAVSFQGVTRGAPFEINGSQARAWLLLPLNPNGQSNSKVIKPLLSGGELARRPKDRWVIDFDNLSLEAAALYEAPFAYAERIVKPIKEKNNRPLYRTYWWKFSEARPGMFRAIAPLKRFIVTPKASRHRFFLLGGNTGSFRIT